MALDCWLCPGQAAPLSVALMAAAGRANLVRRGLTKKSRTWGGGLWRVVEFSKQATEIVPAHPKEPRQALGQARLHQSVSKLGGAYLIGDGLRLLGPSPTPDCLLGCSGRALGPVGVFRKCRWSDEVAFKPKPSVELGGCGVCEPRKEAPLT